VHAFIFVINLASIQDAMVLVHNVGIFLLLYYQHSSIISGSSSIECLVIKGIHSGCDIARVYFLTKSYSQLLSVHGIIYTGFVVSNVLCFLALTVYIKSIIR
jgi:hypothetical protein